MVKWLDNAVFYEIYPQSFNDTNEDGIGDFDGIIEKLDYIKELGCNAIWMNPCFESPFLDAGYDISDYYKTAPRYGTNEDLKRLFDEVHKREMHIILDLVPGHTSIEHKWFKESAKAEKNEYSGRYVWNDDLWGAMGEMSQVGLNILIGCSERAGACAVNFFTHQPALNYGFYEPDPTQPWQQSSDSADAKATVEEMKNIMRFWLRMGCDGFRVDMAASLVKNDPEKKGTIALWQDVFKFLEKEFPDAAMVSEWGDPGQSLMSGFHMDFLLHFGPSHYMDLFRCDEPFFSSRGKGDISEFVNTYKENLAKTNNKGLMCIPSGNHDMTRLSYYLHGDELKIAFAFLLSMPGAPFIYYGDEIGMKFIENITSVEGGYNRTGSRAPMLWDDSVNAGFSTAPKESLYIKQDDNPKRETAKSQMENKDSLYHEIKKLISVRQAHSALMSNGQIEFVYAEKNSYPFAYVRSDENEKILVVINPSAKEVSFDCDLEPKEKIYSFGKDIAKNNGKITVSPQTAVFYAL